MKWRPDRWPGRPEHLHHPDLRVIEQPLGPIRCRVTDVLSDLPTVLARQVSQQRAHVFARLPMHLNPGERWPQPLMQLCQVGRRPLPLYDGSRSRLPTVFVHSMIVAGRLLT